MLIAEVKGQCRPSGGEASNGMMRTMTREPQLQLQEESWATGALAGRDAWEQPQRENLEAPVKADSSTTSERLGRGGGLRVPRRMVDGGGWMWMGMGAQSPRGLGARCKLQ